MVTYNIDYEVVHFFIDRSLIQIFLRRVVEILFRETGFSTESGT